MINPLSIIATVWVGVFWGACYATWFLEHDQANQILCHTLFMMGIGIAFQVISWIAYKVFKSNKGK